MFMDCVFIAFVVGKAFNCDLFKYSSAFKFKCILKYIGKRCAQWIDMSLVAFKIPSRIYILFSLLVKLVVL